MFSADHLWELLKMGWLSNVPLTIGSVLTLSIFCERVWTLRGLEKATRVVVSQVIDALTRRDLGAARGLCESSDTPAAKLLLEGLRWDNVAIEDLDRVFATKRAEMTLGLRRGLWIIGTTGSLAPFVGLFGTVIGIIRAFGDMAVHGSSGFAIVAQGISEALVATAAGLGVAIIALMLFNYLQVRVGAVSAAYARGSERLVQAMLFVEASTRDGREGREVPDVDLVSA